MKAWLNMLILLFFLNLDIDEQPLFLIKFMLRSMLTLINILVEFFFKTDLEL